MSLLSSDPNWKPGPVIQTGDLVVDVDARFVKVDRQTAHLTGKEYGVLELLSLNKGTTVTKEMFLKHLYSDVEEPEMKIIDVFVCKLRKKLADASGGNHYIETVWGRGYTLRDPRPATVGQSARQWTGTVSGQDSAIAMSSTAS